jgi:hypothetical protein
LLLVARIKEGETEGQVWDRIEGAIPLIAAKGITPLYLSKRSHHLDTSLIVSSPSVDLLLEVLLKVLAGTASADGILIFQLVKPKFFDIPENIGKDATRFLITIAVRPADSLRVYELISGFRQSSDFAITYLAFTCQSYCDALTLSAFAKSTDHMNRFVEQELKAIPQITRVTTTPLTKSKRLLPYAEMVRVLRNEVGDISIARPMMDLTDLL